MVPDNFVDEKHFPNNSLATVTEKLGWKLKLVPFLNVPTNGWVAEQRYANVMNKLWIWCVLPSYLTSMFTKQY